jgi:NDP-sugar pyrophosphorylase family protein
MQSILIAGGFGTRLRPVTDTCPKPALPIMGRPFLEYQLDLLKKVGIKRVVFSLHYLADQMIKIFGDGSQYGMEFYYAIESDPLGTGGGIKNCEAYLTDDPVLIFNADVLTDIKLDDVIDFHYDRRARITIVMTPVDDPTMYGVIFTEPDGKILKFLEKPKREDATQNTINAGIYIYERDVFNEMPPGVNYSVERQLYPDMLNAGQRLYGFATDRYWLDIGTPEKFLKAHWDLMDGKVNLKIGGTKVRSGIWTSRDLAHGQENVLDRPNVKPPLYIEYGGQFDENAEIGPYVVLNRMVKLRGPVKVQRAIFMDNSSAHGAVEVKDSIVHYNTEVFEGTKINSVGIYKG